MAFQPIVDLQTGAIHAHEALARFPGSGRGPAWWLESAERQGLRGDLERLCLERALAVLAECPTRLAVNLSAPTLAARETIAILDRHRDLSHLIIEITENTSARMAPALRAAARRICERGTSVAVDDIGSDHASLSQIVELGRCAPPAYLKLDRRMVEGIDANPTQNTLVQLFLEYAARVGSLVIAEGIETEAELAELVRLGVPLGQGYLLGRPTPDGWGEANRLAAIIARAREIASARC